MFLVKNDLKINSKYVKLPVFSIFLPLFAVLVIFWEYFYFEYLQSWTTIQLASLHTYKKQNLLNFSNFSSFAASFVVISYGWALRKKRR